MTNDDLYHAARFTRSTAIEDLDYPKLLRDRDQRWRERCAERGLDADADREQRIRTAHDEQQRRSGLLPRPRTWLRRILDALR